jgi:hypothetical protein
MQQGREDDEYGREKSFWHLWRRVTEARAQARATAEVELWKTDLLAWPGVLRSAYPVLCVLRTAKQGSNDFVIFRLFRTIVLVLIHGRKRVPLGFPLLRPSDSRYAKLPPR